MDIKIFEEVGWGHSKLAVVVDAALRKLGMNYRFEIIANPRFFPRYNISTSPAITIDGEIVLEGYEPSLDEMIKLLGKKISQ